MVAMQWKSKAAPSTANATMKETLSHSLSLDNSNNKLKFLFIDFVHATCVVRDGAMQSLFPSHFMRSANGKAEREKTSNWFHLVSRHQRSATETILSGGFRVQVIVPAMLPRTLQVDKDDNK